MASKRSNTAATQPGSSHTLNKTGLLSAEQVCESRKTFVHIKRKKNKLSSVAHMHDDTFPFESREPSSMSKEIRGEVIEYFISLTGSKHVH